MGIEQIRAIKEAGRNKTSNKPIKGLIYSNNTQLPNIKRGDYECSKGIMFFRSKWEANYALYLDFLIKQKKILNWEYEAETFEFDKIKFGTKKYTPDFKVWYKNGAIEYHEVKGFMDSRSATKLKRMVKYFPDIKIIMIEKEFYNDMYRKLKTVLKFYK